MGDNVCKGCEKRALGCRTECPGWIAHEAAKAQAYTDRLMLSRAAAVSQRKRQYYKALMAERKRGNRG